MIAQIRSATIVGARGHPVTVEVHVSGQGLPGFTMLGLPDESCREARDRVRAAVMSSELVWEHKKIVVNLAPPQFRKTGSGLDLAIAVGALVAFGVISPQAVVGLAFAGELGLDGSIRPVPGVVPMVGVRQDCDWVVPAASYREAQVAAGGRVHPVSTLGEVVQALTQASDWPAPLPVVVAGGSCNAEQSTPPDLADVRGQPLARLALEVAAAGGHHVLFIGPPGAGKTMLAERLPGLLPDLAPGIALETTMIHSAAGLPLPAGGLVTRPPFRSPHHTSSVGSLVGGGGHQHRPGEVSLATNGVLFLDEMGQFNPKALDGLREALEHGHIMVGRVEQQRVPMPARFQLIGASNPCPCGGGAVPGQCQCDDRRRSRYLARLSGPLLDRFDIRVGVRRPGVEDILGNSVGESTAQVATRVATARAVALERRGMLNTDLGEPELEEFAVLDTAATDILKDRLERGHLTARGFARVRRVARTIADLAGRADTEITAQDVTTALTIRARIGASAVEQAA